MSIDREAGGAAPRAEWKVCVSVSVLENVPRDVLTAWMAVESYADSKGLCWPDNQTLARRMGVGSIRSAKRAVLKLVEYGIVARHDQGGNRRSLVMLRRVSEPMSRAEWAVLQERGEARAENRPASKNVGPGVTSKSPPNQNLEGSDH